jgi:hypothetical protein
VDEPSVTLVTLVELRGYLPEQYLGLVQASAASATEAVQALEQRALNRVRRAQADAVRRRIVTTGAYVVLGMKITAGINASGQPVWVAYGTLARGHLRA